VNVRNEVEPVDARTNRHDGTVSALVARQRGRARLRAATAALAGASLIGAGAVAYHLPSATQSTASGQTAVSGHAAGTAANSGVSGTAVHATSGGSGVAASTSVSGTQRGTAPAASSGQAHVTSGGS
jgi:hypothetical protein